MSQPTIRNYEKEQVTEKAQPENLEKFEDYKRPAPPTIKGIKLVNDLTKKLIVVEDFKQHIITVFPDFVHFYLQATQIFNEISMRYDITDSSAFSPASSLMLAGYSLLYILLYSEIAHPRHRTQAGRAFFLGPSSQEIYKQLETLKVPAKLAAILETFLPSYTDSTERVYVMASLDTYYKAKDESKLIPPWAFGRLQDEISVLNAQIDLRRIISQWPNENTTYDQLLNEGDVFRARLSTALQDGNTRHYNRRAQTNSVSMGDITQQERQDFAREAIYDQMLNLERFNSEEILRILHKVSEWFSSIHDGISLSDITSHNGGKILDHCILKPVVINRGSNQSLRKCIGLCFSESSMGDKAIPVCGGKYIVIEDEVNLTYKLNYTSLLNERRELVLPHTCELTPVKLEPQDGSEPRRVELTHTWSSYRFRTGNGDTEYRYILNVAGLGKQPPNSIRVKNYIRSLVH